MLNKQKNEGPVRKLRDGWRVFQNWARMDKALKTAELNDTARADLVKKAESAREQLNSLEKNIQSSEAEASGIEDEIYKVNQPVTRHYVLQKVD